MKKHLVSIAALAAVALTLPAVAQQQPAPQPAPQAQPAPDVKKSAIPRNTFFKGQRAGEWLAKDRLIGLRVRNKEGTVIGDIEDIIFDRDDRVIGVIMGVGGLLGVGEKKIGVMIGALQITRMPDGQTQIVMPAATKSVLSAVRPYERAQAKRTLLQKAKEAGKDALDRGKDAASSATQAAKDAAQKAKDAVSGSGGSTEPKK